MRKVLARDLTKEDRDSAVFKKTQIRIPVDAAAKHIQTGPAWDTQEWADMYSRGRNTIEAVTPFSRTGVWGLGHKTRRLVRRFANATFVTAFGIVGVNIHLIQKFLHRVVFDLNMNPSDPVPTQPCKRLSDWNTLATSRHRFPGRRQPKAQQRPPPIRAVVYRAWATAHLVKISPELCCF